MKRTAIKAAKEAGKIILSYYSKNVNAVSKGSTYNLVTKVDIASEDKIISIIKDKFPGHSIMTEESGEEIHKSDYCWVIDPLDGTNNFIMNFQCFVYQLHCTKKVNP